MVVPKEDNFLINKFAGINAGADAELIDDSELVVCSGLILGSSGELIKQDGTRTWNNLPSGGGYYVLGQFFMSNGTIRTILYTGVSTKKVYYTDVNPAGGAPTWTEITTFSGLTTYSGVQLNDAFYVSDSAGVHKYTTGTTAALLGSSPVDIDGLVSFQTQVFGFKGSTLYYTSIANPDVWAAPGGFLNIFPGDGDNITCIIPIGDRILIFKRTSVWILYLADDPVYWQVRGLNAEIGCTSKEAAKNIRGLIYFLSIRGMWVTDGVTFTRLSSNIEPMLTNRYGDLSSDSLILYGDEYILINFGATEFMYRFIQPRGFTQVNGWAGALKRIRTSTDSDYVAGCAFSLIRASIPGRGPDSQTVTISIKTKAWNIEDRVSRAKRGKYCIVGLGTKNQNTTVRPSYYWTADDQDTVPADFPAKSKTGTEAMKIQGPGYGRTFQLSIDESSTGWLEIHFINLVGMLKRQQIEATV